MKNSEIYGRMPLQYGDRSMSHRNVCAWARNIQRRMGAASVAINCNKLHFEFNKQVGRHTGDNQRIKADKSAYEIIISHGK
jgi:hypothetical protein